MASFTLPPEASTSALSPISLPSSSRSSSSNSQNGDDDRQAKRRLARIREREKNRIIAASTGALITSLTMTPFDVVRIRLQTQQMQESLFIPSSQVPPPSRSATSAAASTSAIEAARRKGKGKAPASTVLSPLQHARSLAATNLATCCQKTYFTTNLAEKDILCRFDPREITAASAAGATASASRSTLRLPSVSRVIPISFTTPTGGTAALAMNAGEACLYPSSTIAAEQLPNLSAQSSRHFNGFFDAFVKIGRHEGLPALWRGLSPSLVMSVPSQVIYMVGYDNLRTAALEHAPARYVSPVTGTASRSYIATTTFLAGSVSRAAVATLLAPLELFRTRMQSTGTHVSFANVTSSITDLVRKQGATSLWRGLSATLWRDVPFSGIYWAGYEAIRRVLSDGRGMGEVAHGDQASKTFAVAFASGAGSGIIASFVSHPFDVIKTRRQTENSTQSNRGTLAICKEVIRSEGWQGLWRGLVPRLAKVAPACGIMIGAYEMGLRWTSEDQS